MDFFSTLSNVLKIVLMLLAVWFSFSKIKNVNASTKKIMTELSQSHPQHSQPFDLGAWLERSAPAFGSLVMLSSLAMLYFLEYGPDRNQPLTVKEASDIVQSMLLFLVGLVIARRW